MLARLDEVIASARHSAVNREGTLLRVQSPDDEEEIKRRVIETVTEMSYFAQHIDHLPEDVTRWYSYAEIEELSAEEAKVPAELWVQELRELGPLALEGSDLRRVLEDMLWSTFRRAAKTGIVQVDLGDLRHDGMEGVESDDFEQIRQWLIRKLDGGEHLPSE